jgi:hypothetical protein
MSSGKGVRSGNVTGGLGTGGRERVKKSQWRFIATLYERRMP